MNNIALLSIVSVIILASAFSVAMAEPDAQRKSGNIDSFPSPVVGQDGHHVAVILPITENWYEGELYYHAERHVNLISLRGPLEPGEFPNNVWRSADGQRYEATIISGEPSGFFEVSGNAIGLHSSRDRPFTASFSVHYIEKEPEVDLDAIDYTQFPEKVESSMNRATVEITNIMKRPEFQQHFTHGFYIVTGRVCAGDAKILTPEIAIYADGVVRKRVELSHMLEPNQCVRGSESIRTENPDTIFARIVGGDKTEDRVLELDAMMNNVREQIRVLNNELNQYFTDPSLAQDNQGRIAQISDQISVLREQMSILRAEYYDLIEDEVN